MGHYAPPTGFAWPVPPEELADLQVFFLEWSADGHVTVREQPVAAGQPRTSVLPRLPLARVDASPRREKDGAAPIRIQLACPAAPEAGDAPRQPAVRERATWLGIGTLMGIALAASTLPDASTADGRRIAIERPGPPVGTPARPPAAAPEARRVAAVGANLPASTPRTQALQPATPLDSPPALVPRDRRRASQAADAAPAAVAAPRRAVAERVRPPRPSAAMATAVLQEVRRYEVAYTRMDAAATHAVWPAADREALVRQFTGLREQHLRLERCAVETPGDAALVTCRGTLRYRPRLGDHSTRVHRGTWRFALEPRADRWVIAGVDAPADPPARLP